MLYYLFIFITFYNIIFIFQRLTPYYKVIVEVFPDTGHRVCKSRFASLFEI
jgi:hypothetical protein